MSTDNFKNEEKIPPTKNTILTYKLDNQELNLLLETLGKLTRYNINVFTAGQHADVYTKPHFIAFLNFNGISDNEKREFLECWKKNLKERTSLGGIYKYTPPAYILNFGYMPNKPPYLHTDGDIFTNNEKLRLALLQEIKNIEGFGRKANEVSIRLRRILTIYSQLVYRDSISVKYIEKICTNMDAPISSRRLMQDMAIIREIDSAVSYCSATESYEIDWVQSCSTGIKAPTVGESNTKIKRVLRICRYLANHGWITKRAAESVCGPISYRTFLRDMSILRDISGRDISYDAIQKRYTWPYILEIFETLAEE